MSVARHMRCPVQTPDPAGQPASQLQESDVVSLNSFLYSSLIFMGALSLANRLSRALVDSRPVPFFHLFNLGPLSSL